MLNIPVLNLRQNALKCLGDTVYC